MQSSALRNRNFLTYLIGNTISLHGLWVYRVALGWSAWQLTESEFWVGLVAFTQFFPVMLFGPLFGVLADRFNRRLASLLINSLSAGNMLLLSVLAASDDFNITVLVLPAFIQGVLDSAHMPVRMSLVANLVPKIQLQSAIASASIAFNLSRFSGPVIAGLIITVSGVAAAFITNAVSYLAILGALLMVRQLRENRPESRHKHIGKELREGFLYVIHHKSIRLLLIVIAIASVFGRGSLEMLPPFADAVFHRGSGALAMLTSAIGAGAIAGGVLLSRGTAWLNTGIVIGGTIASGIMISVFAMLENFWLALPVIALLGMVLSLCGVGSQILLQSLVDDEIRGRVSGLWGMVAFGGTAFGGLLIGTVARLYGLTNTILVAGLSCAVLAGIVAWRRHYP